MRGTGTLSTVSGWQANSVVIDYYDHVMASHGTWHPGRRAVSDSSDRAPDVRDTVTVTARRRITVRRVSDSDSDRDSDSGSATVTVP